MVNIAFAKGGCSLTHSARTLPAVHPEMTIWGVKGGSPAISFGLNDIFFVTCTNPFWKKSKWKERRIMPSLVGTTYASARTLLGSKNVQLFYASLLIQLSLTSVECMRCASPNAVVTINNVTSLSFCSHSTQAQSRWTKEKAIAWMKANLTLTKTSKQTKIGF